MSKFCSDLCVCAPHSLHKNHDSSHVQINHASRNTNRSKVKVRELVGATNPTGQWHKLLVGNQRGQPRTCRWGRGWGRMCRAPRGSRWRSGGSAPAGAAARPLTASRTRPRGGAEPSPSRGVGLCAAWSRAEGSGGW